MPLTLSPSVFAILRAIVEEKIGFHYDDGQREIFASKVASRAVDAGFESLLDYYYYLRYDPRGDEEMERLVDHLVVNETYFFRERSQLDVLVRRVISPQVRRREGKRVRVWSSACSTGEEPLTLAMLLAAEGLLDDVDIVATDISPKALAQAASGIYGRRSLRQEHLPPEAERWIKRNDNKLQVSTDLTNRIEWRRLNLLDAQEVSGLGQFTVILCRNVLIYFSDATTKRVVETLTRSLEPDGVLAVGISESLLRYGTSLACDEQDGAFLYRKAVA